MGPRADAESTPVSPGHRAKTASTATASSATSSTAASFLEQLIAIHAIASQADVSLFLEDNAALAAKHVARFCKESSELGPSPFHDGPHLRDAAERMASESDWAEPERFGRLHLPDPLADRVSAAAERWPEVLNAADFSTLDFSWLGGLAAFDHWSLVQAKPWVDPPIPDLVFAIPNYVTLMRWAKLRWAQALARGDVTVAASELRHLAALIRSHQILLAEMVSIQFLVIEREAYDAALRRGLDVSGWQPADEAEVQNRRRLTRVEASFLFPGVDPAVMRQALSCAPAPCVALGEAAWVHVTIGAFSPDDSGAAFWSLADGAECDHDLINSIRAGAPMSAERARQVFEGTSPFERAFGPAAP